MKRFLVLMMVLIAGQMVQCKEALVAVIDNGGAKDLCSLLESRLAEDKNWQVYSRDPALVAEKQLESLVKQSDWGALSKLTRVDVLVLAGKDENKKLWARVVAIAPATVLTETWFNHDPAQVDVQAGYLKSLLDRDRAKLAADRANVIKLSVGSVAANPPNTYVQTLEQPLKNRLLHRLANDARVILNERRNLDNVVWERSLDATMKIAPPTGQTALSCNLVRKGLQLQAQCSLLFQDGRSFERVFPMTLHPKRDAELDNSGTRNLPSPASDELQLDTISQDIATWVSESCLGKTGNPTAFSEEAEAAYYARQARFLVNCGMASQGAAAADAAWALGHRSHDLLRHQIMAHALIAFPQWDGLEEWDLTRPPQSGFNRTTYTPIDLAEEPWRMTEAIRTAELMRTYLHLYKDRTPEGFDDDPRIIGARCLFNALCVLLSAYEYDLQNNPAYAPQLSTLRSLIAHSAEELLRMPCTENSAALYSQLSDFIPIWADSLEKRMEIWDLYLEGPKELSVQNWFGWTVGSNLFDLGGEMSMRGFYASRLWEKGPKETIKEKGNIAGMVFPWEPDALNRRKQLLDTFVSMTRSPDPEKQAKGWVLWLLWWTNENQIRDRDHVSRFDHDFPGFNFREEARAAWGAPKDVDFQKWIETKQKEFAQAVKPRLPKYSEAYARRHAEYPVVPRGEIKFYQWYLREKLISEWAQEKEKSYVDPYRASHDLYIPPRSLISLPPLKLNLKKPEVDDKEFSYFLDHADVYLLPKSKTGRILRLDPVRNRALGLDIPDKIQAAVDTGIEQHEMSWQEKPNVTVRLGTDVSWLIGGRRFAYRLGNGDWRIEESPGGTPVLLKDRLYFLAATDGGAINLHTGSKRGGALYEFNPQDGKTTCLFSTRRFPPRTILDAREPAHPVAVCTNSQGVLHVLTAEDKRSLWCVYRRKPDGDFERVNSVRIPRPDQGTVYSCGGQNFLSISGRFSNPPVCFWDSWALLDGDSPGGLKVLWQDPRIPPAYLPFPSEIPPGRENGAYVRHENLSYRIESLGKYPPNFEKKSRNRRFQIEILDHHTKQYYSVPLAVEPLTETDEIYFSSFALAATADGLWMGCGDRYALVPYTDISPKSAALPK